MEFAIFVLNQLTHSMQKTLVQSILYFTLFSIASIAAALDDSIAAQVEATQTAHNLESWWGKDLVEADVVIDFGGNQIVDGTFLFEAHGPKARYDRADGTSIIFDGETAWLTPSDAKAPMGRFHVLTWPWFILAPFKMAGDGIELSDLSTAVVDGQEYVTLFQTFADGEGDTPEDWYRFYIDPETDQIEAMSYIVTYGKETDEASDSVSIIRYKDYSNEGGPVISRAYEFWYWNPDDNQFEGEKPKGTGKISNVSYPEQSGDPFAIPDDARKLELPAVNQ